MANSLAFRAVTKRFGSVVAVNNVSFDIASGETVALLGPSGCGKTTILRVIAGFETPDAGSLQIGGVEMAGRRPYERNVGLLFQHYALFPHMTVAQNVGYGLRYRGLPRSEIGPRVSEMLELVKLPGHGGRYPNQLSGGQQQRIALARALATQPSILLLDEPLSALDVKLRQELRAELKDVLATVGSTAIVVTHDHEEAMSLGHRVFVMNQGRIAQSGTPDDIYVRPTSRFVADFMGHANWFTGRRTGPSEYATDCGRILNVVPCTQPSAEQCDLCLRPESIDLLPATIEAGPNRLFGHVADVILTGASRQLIVTLEDGRSILVLQQNRTQLPWTPGQGVVLGFPPEACVLVPRDSS